MTTKTRPAPPTPEQARDDLLEARGHLDRLHRRILDGDTAVTADDLSGARAGIELAELRVALADDQDAAADRNRRRDRARQLINSILTGDIRQAAEQAATAHARTVEAFRQLLHDSIAYQQTFTAALNELRRLGEDAMPDGYGTAPGHLLSVGLDALHRDGTAVVYLANLPRTLDGALDAVLRDAVDDSLLTTVPKTLKTAHKQAQYSPADRVLEHRRAAEADQR